MISLRSVKLFRTQCFAYKIKLNNFRQSAIPFQDLKSTDLKISAVRFQDLSLLKHLNLTTVPSRLELENHLAPSCHKIFSLNSMNK